MLIVLLGHRLILTGNAPTTGAYIEVKTTGLTPSGQLTQTTLISDAFNSNLRTDSFTLVNGSPSSKEVTMVYIKGVYQSKANYNLTSGAIVFSSAVTLGDEVEVISVSGANLTTSPVTSVDGNTCCNICSYKCKWSNRCSNCCFYNGCYVSKFEHKRHCQQPICIYSKFNFNAAS